MSKTLDMTRGSPFRLLLSFALPLMFGNMFQQLYTVVDVAIVGQGVGMDALAALGTVDWLNWMLLGIAQGYTQGFSVRISQKFGEKDFVSLKRLFGQSAIQSVLIALVGAFIGQLGLPLFLSLLRVPSDLVGTAMLYTRILMGGFPIVMFYNFCASVLRAVGDSKTPLTAMLAASVINILLDVLTVFVLGWGVAGAAIATVISQCISGGICLLRILKLPELRLEKRLFQPKKEYQWDLVKIGSPIATKNIIISLGGMAVQTIVNGFGMSFIAGFTATNKLYGLLEIAALSYGYAVTTYVGQNYGASQFDRIRKGIRAAVVLSLITSVVISLLMFVFGRQITMLFISSDVPQLMTAAGDTSYTYLCVMSSALPALYLLYVYLSALQGLGNSLIPMISGIAEFVLRVGVAIVVGILAYEKGIFFAEIVAWIGAAIFLMFHYYRAMRKICSTKKNIS